MAPPSLAMLRAWAILPKVTGWISFLFSGLVVVTVVRDKNRRNLCYHRLLFGISLSDMSASLWLGLGTWPIPEGGGLWAVGNNTTCRVQGFFTQLGVCSSFYNASLSTYYWLVVVRGWREDKLRKIEWLLHGIPMAWALVSAIVGLVLDVYGNATLWCWVSVEHEVFRWAAFYGPLWFMIGLVTMNCVAIYRHVRKIEAASAKHRLFRESAIRRDMAQNYEEWAEDTPSGMVSAEHSSHSVALSRGDVFLEGSTELRESGSSRGLVKGRESEEVKEVESSSAASRPESQTSRRGGAPAPRSSTIGFRRSNRRLTTAGNWQRYNRQKSLYWRSRRVKEVADQCFLYAAAFYVNWLALTTVRVIQTFDGKVYLGFILIAAITVPMQGLPNFLVYLRPKLARIRKKYPKAGWLQLFQRSLARNASVAGQNAQVSSAPHFNPSEINGNSGVSILEELEADDDAEALDVEEDDYNSTDGMEPVDEDEEGEEETDVNLEVPQAAQKARIDEICEGTRIYADA